MLETADLVQVGVTFAYAGALLFVLLGLALSFRRGRLHPLLLLCVAAISISWIEAPYDWAMYAQFPPELPRMPSWWPLNLTWGGLPASVPPGYIPYFALPATIAVFLGQRLNARMQWRAPLTLLGVGLVVGCVWAFAFNAGLGARLGLFQYGRVIEGLALWPGTKHQYPLYDTLAMGIQMMVFTYLLGRTDAQGRSLIERWSDAKARGRVQSGLLSIAAVIVVGHGVYLSVFAPHLATKMMGLVTVGPTAPLYEGVPNQPL
ncbi:MAG TPA: spirocyclase AveC family protein [Nevskiaceae bacterium]|nr:spirocyclase AveC family protein [Nevskiaceae bacterium]